MKHYANLWTILYNCCQVKYVFSDIPVFEMLLALTSVFAETTPSVWCVWDTVGLYVVTSTVEHIYKYILVLGSYNAV